MNKMMPGLLTALLFLASLHASTSMVEADGEIAGQVVAQNSGSRVFWVVVLPANFPQPVTLEQVRPYGVAVTGGTFRLPNLKPGKYLVALIESPSEMRVVTPTFVKVEAPAWVKASGFNGVGLWPAFEVEIKDAQQASPPVSVRFERKPFPRPPVDVQPPRAGGVEAPLLSPGGSSAFARFSGSFWTLLVGALLFTVSSAIVTVSIARRFKHRAG